MTNDAVLQNEKHLTKKNEQLAYTRTVKPDWKNIYIVGGGGGKKKNQTHIVHSWAKKWAMPKMAKH